MLSLTMRKPPQHNYTNKSAHLSSYSAEETDLAAADLLAACLGGTDVLFSLLISLEEYLLLS